MYVLGIGHDLWISAAALVYDGEVVAAVCEERLNRLKKYKGFPSKSIDMCLREARITADDLDLIVCGWNPAMHMESLNPRFSSSARWRPEYLYSIPNYMLQKAVEFPFGPIEQKFSGFKAPIVYMDHQMAHASNAFYLSPFEKAAVFTADGRGERHTTSFGVGGPEGVKQLGEVLYPNSLGLFYGMITQYLGFVPDSDEWKVMALASYGNGENNPFYPALKSMVVVDGDGVFKLDLSMCGFYQPDAYGDRFYSDNFLKTMKMPPRRQDEPITEMHHQLAWALQQTFEETMSACLTALHNRTGKDNLVVSGGCIMNSVYNGRITSQTPFQQVFISSSPDDSGIPVGAALWGYYEYLNQRRRRVEHQHDYWGPSYEDEIEETLKKYKLPYEKLDDGPREAAKIIADGKLVGWFQGRMEFGQRALGNRSILADPRREESKDLVNLSVKYRESFRPFAPSIMAEKVEKYFHTEGNGTASFMERVYMFKDEVKKKVPAVVHVDGSGRLQTVEKETNPRYYALIRAFENITGVPIVLNTSFNLNGEPIVCSPTDAIRTFFSCGLDVLILEDYLIRKT